MYVIFICTWDPFGSGLPLRTFRSSCVEAAGVSSEDGAIDVVLNASGDPSKESLGLASLLQYVEPDSTDSSDLLTTGLSRAVSEAHEDEEWVKNMSRLDWDIHDAKVSAAEEGHAKGLEEGGAEGLVEGREEGRAEGGAVGFAEGRNDERSRRIGLMDAMEAACCALEEILSALRSSDLETCYECYGVGTSN